MIYRSCRIAAIFLAVLLCLSGRLQAQATATVTGVVTDPSESVLVDANVTLTNSSTGTQYTAKTNSAGSYRLTNLPPGPGYTLTISLLQQLQGRERLRERRECHDEKCDTQPWRER